MFDGFDVDLGDRVGAGDGSTPEDQETDDEPGSRRRPRRSSARADELLREAEAALEDDNDLGEYQAKVDEAAALIDEALDALQPATTTPAGEPSTEHDGAGVHGTVHGRRLSGATVSSRAARRSRRRLRRSGRRCGPRRGRAGTA